MSNMRLEAGSGWLGTFGNAIAFVARDMLADGAPVSDVTVVTHRGPITGYLTAADNSTVTIAGVAVEIEEIEVFEVDC